MVTVFIPTMLQPLSGGVKQVAMEVKNVRQIVDELERLYPGIKEKLVDEGQIRPNISVAVDGEIARMGILEKVDEGAEVHFVPAIGGGATEAEVAEW